MYGTLAFHGCWATDAVTDATEAVLNYGLHGLVAFDRAAVGAGAGLPPEWSWRLAADARRVWPGDGWIAVTSITPGLTVFDVGGPGSPTASFTRPEPVAALPGFAAYESMAEAGAWRAPYALTVASVPGSSTTGSPADDDDRAVLLDLSDPLAPRARGACRVGRRGSPDQGVGYRFDVLDVTLSARTGVVWKFWDDPSTWAVDLRDPDAPRCLPIAIDAWYFVASGTADDVCYASAPNTAARPAGRRARHHGARPLGRRPDGQRAARRLRRHPTARPGAGRHRARRQRT